MATGSGKTIVMAMLIAWHILNKISIPRDSRFSKNVFVVAPGLTVRNRLSVLDPNNDRNYYKLFKIVPGTMLDKLRQGNIIIKNWHVMLWDDHNKLEKRRSVDKRGVKSDFAYVKNVLGDMASSQQILVINDEAHHAWRITDKTKASGLSKELRDKATKWIAGLDRIHKKIKILTCHDFSATPFVPSGKTSSDENLFNWIVSDFGLNDAIESGLVKTPRIVFRDDNSRDLEVDKSKLYHIFKDDDVSVSFNQRAKPEKPLPTLVLNAYMLLGMDWLKTQKQWEKNKMATPPVMITVANRTETAARIKYAFENKRIEPVELCDSNRILHIDSNVLNKAEDEFSNVSQALGKKKKEAELLREQVDTVGKKGQPGEHIQNVISVDMLSEGWDARTVTHIMGLRAFSSQLLCEQVVGRGLRRTAYEINPKTRLFDSEYVNVFGVPFSFLPHEGGEGTPPPPTKEKYLIEPDKEKIKYEIKWPNIIRIEHIVAPILKIDWSKVKPLELDASRIVKIAELAPTIDGKQDASYAKMIDLESLANESPRLQKSIFITAIDVFEQMKEGWAEKTGYSKPYLLAQLVQLTEIFMNSELITVIPEIYQKDDFRRRLVFSFSTYEIMNHIKDLIDFQCVESLEPLFDNENPILSTNSMLPWYTSKPNQLVSKSHINSCVFDSSWERSDALDLESSEHVEAWVKNDHLGFEIDYVYKGSQRKYRPDFIVQLTNGKKLVVETKGKETEKDKIKQKYLKKWIKAINTHGGFGTWASAITRKPGEIKGIITTYANT